MTLPLVRLAVFGGRQNCNDIRPAMRYTVVIEKAENNYSAYVPDLPGCVSTGATLEETEAMIREAIEFHLEGMREEGLPIPEATTVTKLLEV